MGRIGDAEVHQAFVEFRAKESDKVLYTLIFSSYLLPPFRPTPSQAYMVPISPC